MKTLVTGGAEIIRTITIVLRNMILGSNIVSLTLLTNPRKMFIYIQENLFLYKTLNSKRGIQQKNVFEVLQAENVEKIKLGNLDANGPTWFFSSSSYLADLVSLCLICRIVKPKIVFEIGTFNGYTSFHFALNTADDAKIYTLDLPKDDSVNLELKRTLIDKSYSQNASKLNNYRFSNSDVESKITCLFGDSAKYDFSDLHGKVDFFFVDGAHSYEYVRSDTINALKCTRPGGVIAWHDFARAGVNGVSKFILELSKKHEIYSVPGSAIAFMVVN